MGDEVKKPLPGEWWVSDEGRVYICGFDVDGDPVYHFSKNDHVECRPMEDFLDLFVHEPECTGFNWTPQDWVELPPDHILRKGVDQYKTCLSDRWDVVDGLAGKPVSYITSKRARCLRKDLPVVESPEDWVIQDRVPARDRIDRGWWVTKGCGTPSYYKCWWRVGPHSEGLGKMHGYVKDNMVLNLCCRRKDLPTMYPKYYTNPCGFSDDTVFIRRTSDTAYETVAARGVITAKGRWGETSDAIVARGGWTKVSEAEALDRLDKSAPRKTLNDRYGEPEAGWRWLDDDEKVEPGDEAKFFGEFKPSANHSEGNRSQSTDCRPYRRRVKPEVITMTLNGKTYELHEVK